MYPAPHQRFIAALAESRRVVSRVEMHWPDDTVTELPHTGGEINVDGGSEIRRTATIDLDDPSRLPFTAAEYLAISGVRLRIRCGVVIDGEPVTVPVFTGRLDGIDGDPDTGPVSIEASGLEAFVQDDKFAAAYSTRSSTAAITSITALIQDTLPDAVVVSDLADDTLGARTWDAGDDRWAAVQEIATAVGAEVYTDAAGQFVVAAVPDVLTSEVAWEVAAGEGGVLISASRGWSRTGMYNVVVASGENAEEDTAPVTATAEDDDPTSPTYVDGPFGRVPRFYSSPTLTSSGLAQGAANALLAKSVKPAVTADITSLPNHLLEPGDVIRVVYADGRRTLHQVRSFSIRLAPGGSFTLQMVGGKEDA